MGFPFQDSKYLIKSVNFCFMFVYLELRNDAGPEDAMGDDNEDEESEDKEDSKARQESIRTNSLHSFRVCCRNSNSKKCTNCQKKSQDRLNNKIYINGAFKTHEINEDLDHNENLDAKQIEHEKNILILSKSTKAVDVKPVLKFSVSAILGTDHGKPAFRSGKKLEPIIFVSYQLYL